MNLDNNTKPRNRGIRNLLILATICGSSAFGFVLLAVACYISGWDRAGAFMKYPFCVLFGLAVMFSVSSVVVIAAKMWRKYESGS